MRVYGVRAADGVEVWRYQTAGRVRATATVAGDDVIVASDDGSVHCIRSRSAIGAADARWTAMKCRPRRLLHACLNGSLGRGLSEPQPVGVPPGGRHFQEVRA